MGLVTGLEWVKSGCPRVLGRGFEGKLSSTTGVFCPLCSKEEEELDLLFHWDSDLYWLIFHFERLDQGGQPQYSRTQRKRESALGNGSKFLVQEGRCEWREKAEWMGKGAPAHIPGSSGLWKVLHLATRWCCQTKARAVYSTRSPSQPVWGEEGVKQRSLSPTPTLGAFLL